MRRHIPHFLFLSCVLLCAVCLRAQHQTRMPPPPPSLDTPKVESKAEQTTAHLHIDFLAAQRDADELARIAQTIPPDVFSVRKGMLPKDVIGKLKQIEKLSKHLRSQLNP